MAVTAQERRQIRDLWRKLLTEIGPAIELQLKTMSERGDGNAAAVNPGVVISQNLLRICLEEALEESSRGFMKTPAQAETFLAELGIRLAAYCISAAPVERQGALTEAISAGLADCVSGMRAKGFVIRCEWNFGWGWEANLPAGGMN